MGSNDTLNYLAGNPILINIFTGVNASGRYRIYSGTGYATLLFEGNVFSVSGIAQVDITELFENLKTSAGITPAKKIKVSCSWQWRLHDNE